MKRIFFLIVAAVLLPTGTASANLTVHEYVAGEFVIEDTDTGNYWYWNLADFVNKTYDQQITAIGDLGNYGGIAGGWHMASLSEMQTLIPYTENPSAFVSYFCWPSSTKPFYGRFNYILYHETGAHAYFVFDPSGLYWPTPFISQLWDWDHLPSIGAWVTTDSPVVPAPPAVVLATTGLLCLLGAKLRGRRR